MLTSSQVQRLDRVVHVLGQPADLVAELGLVGLAVAAHVERDHAVAIGEAVELVPELLGGLRPARDHQDRLARARFQVIEADAVAGRDVADLARALAHARCGSRCVAVEATAAVTATALGSPQKIAAAYARAGIVLVELSLIVMSQPPCWPALHTGGCARARMIQPVRPVNAHRRRSALAQAVRCRRRPGRSERRPARYQIRASSCRARNTAERPAVALGAVAAARRGREQVDDRADRVLHGEGGQEQQQVHRGVRAARERRAVVRRQPRIGQHRDLAEHAEQEPDRQRQRGELQHDRELRDEEDREEPQHHGQKIDAAPAEPVGDQRRSRGCRSGRRSPRPSGGWRPPSGRGRRRRETMAPPTASGSRYACRR